MPRVLSLPDALSADLTRQDGAVTTAQLLAHGLPRDYASRRVRSGRWQWLLPGVALTVTGEPTRRQRLIGAYLWAGTDAAIDGADACAWYGLRLDGFDPTRVRVVVPVSSSARSTSYVVVRRACTEITVGARGAVPYVDPATAAIVAARGASGPRGAVAVLSRALQTELVSLGGLRDARDSIGDKWCRAVDAALVDVGVGVRSPAERDARRLILTSRVVDEPEWNVWLSLGDGGPDVCVDALWEDSATVHETNGRRYHAWAQQFDDMQARHDRLTAAGLHVLHNPPRRINRVGDEVRSQIERTVVRYAGTGLPAGVTRVNRGVVGF